MPGLGALGARMGARVLGGAGGGGATTTTVEATEIEEVAVPAAAFALPDGYQETSLFQTGPAVPNLNRVPETPAVPRLNNLGN
jgi:hypothetical protein